MKKFLKLKAELYLHPESASAKSRDRKLLRIKMNYIIFNQNPCLLVVISDITDKEIISNLEEVSEYKTKTLNTVSHEMRTPLNGIIGFLETALY